MTNKIKYLDLFAGCGGLSDGFLQTGKFDEVAAVEWLKPQVDTLRKRLADKWGYIDSHESVLHFDIQREKELFQGWEDANFGFSKGLDHLVNNANGIDIVIGGPPCQAYSVAGRVRDENGMKDDYRNYLFEHYLNVVSRYKPKLFVFENVPGMLSAAPGDKAVTDLVKEGFDKIGYEIISDLTKYSLVNSVDYGVPQNRKRVIIIGVRRESIKNPERIQKMLESFYTEILPKFKTTEIETVHKAIGDLQKFKPISSDKKRRIAYEEIPNSGKIVNWHKPRYHSERDKEIFSLLAKDIEDEAFYYTESKALSKLYEERIGSKSPIHRYHVLRTNQPSTTIIAHLHKDGNRFIHYDSKQKRTITPREAARLQSFDDDFEFLGTQGAVYQMIGNAVPPKLAEALGYAVEEFFNLKDERLEAIRP